MKSRNALDNADTVVLTMQPPQPENVTPERIPDPWLADSVWLLEELAKTREAVLRIKLQLDNASDIKSVVDRIWSLEQHLRYLLRLHSEGQWSFRKKAEKAAKKVTASKVVQLRTGQQG
jgi:hypothetical protein